MTDPIRFTLDGREVPAKAGTHPADNEAVEPWVPAFAGNAVWKGCGNGDPIRFSLDGAEVEAQPGETIWQVANRLGTEIPHLCWLPKPGYRADGNCRACMVEIEGERVLAASCIRPPAPGMKVHSASERAKASRRLVFELLVGDQPERAAAHDPNSRLWQWADALEVEDSRFPRRAPPAPDRSHPAMAVQLDACIQCNLCVRACREVQVNDVIGMAGRGWHEKIVFDFDDPMGNSTCVACGECVQACPTGALMPASLVDDNGVYANAPDREVESVCPYCGVGCQLIYQIKDDRIVAVEGKDGPANHNRLCVKGRFGFDYVHHPDRLTEPLIRKDGVAKDDVAIDPANPYTHFRKATWEEALDRAAAGLDAIRDRDGKRALAGFGSAKGSNEEAYLFQKLVRTGFGSNNVDHCTRLCHASSVAALDGGDRLGRGHRAVHRGDRCRRHHRHRRAADREPSGRRDLFQAGGQARRQALRDGPARHRLDAACDRDAALQSRARCRDAQRDAAHDHRGGPLRPAIRAGAHRGFRGAARAYPRLQRRKRWREICGVDAATLREVARTYARAERGDHLLGHGHLAACPRHRQRALPDRAGAGHRPGRPAGHRAAPAARPEQRAGRLGCRR